MNFGANEDTEMIYGNILSYDVMWNMNVIKKKDMIQSSVSLGIINYENVCIDDFLVISKLDNLKLFVNTLRWSRYILELL